MKDSLNKVMQEHEKLVYKIANKYKGYYQIEDLFQVGMIGMINAYKNYNCDFNVKFSSYAYNYILGEIINYIKSDRLIKVSDEYIKIYKLYERTKELLTSKYGRNPILKEICKVMNIEESFLVNVVETVMFTKSIDNETESLLNTYIVDDRESNDNQIFINEELDKLSEFDRSLIVYRYYKDYSQVETAKALGVNQVKVSRQEKLILSKMKDKICA